jgi:REP element-mobilizing transposase RayT
MANIYTSLQYHVVFSTKNRQPFLGKPIRERLFAYLGGIARENAMNALQIGGMADHVHLLLSIPASLPLSKAVQLVKGGSSHWLKATFPNMVDFAWQDGYAAFTVSQSQLDDVRAYIGSQPEHEERKRSVRSIGRFWRGIILSMMNVICWVDFNRRCATRRSYTESPR